MVLRDVTLEARSTLRVAVEDNRHRIPKKFKGLSAYKSALHLDLTFVTLLEELGQPVPAWLSLDVANWQERIERYENR